MMSNLDHTRTCLDEGNAFIARHPELNGTQQTIGGLTWGLLRALMECPNCPGVFRRPRQTVEGIEVLWCSSCGGQWVHQDDLEAVEALDTETDDRQGRLV